MLGSMSWLPLKKRHLRKRCVEVVKRRRDKYVGNGQNLFGVQNREDSGAGQRTAGYGRLCVPHGKSGNLQRIPLCRPSTKKKKLHLELADGSKVQFAHKAPNVPIVVGKTVCKVDFTVTQLLFGVDLVLGINWLALWNPVIDWTL